MSPGTEQKSSSALPPMPRALHLVCVAALIVGVAAFGHLVWKPAPVLTVDSPSTPSAAISPSSTPSPTPAASVNTASPDITNNAAKVNVNTADLETLMTLPGIGTARAQAIIDEREANGPFVSIGDLERVSNLPGKTLEDIAALVIVADE